MTKITVVRPTELGPREVTSWRRMQQACPLFENPFLSPDFCIAVSRVRSDAWIAVLEDGRGPVGFFPFQRNRLGIGKPIGAGVSDCQGVVHSAGLEWDADSLLRGCGLAVWEFDNLLADQAAFARCHLDRERSPIVDLTDGYPAYVERRRSASRQIKTTIAKRERLRKHLGGDLRFEFDLVDHQALEMLTRWKSAQYRRTGRSDRFTRRWIVELIHALLDTRTPECTGVLSVLSSGARTVAAHFGLRCQGTLCCWFPAYDVTLAKFSPGLVLHLLMAEAGAGAGLHRLALGKGDAEYKDALRTGDALVAEGYAYRPSVVAALRRAQMAPRRHLTRFILARPLLRSRARQALLQLGRLRSQTWRA